MEGEKGERRIKLFCPSVSKALQIIAGEDQKLDLGSIARAFGLDPNTLKLNGYYISRGVDLVASSVTWKSLIGFFSARGLSTGADSLLVDGRLSKIGSKRLRNGEDGGNGAVFTEEQGYCRDNKRTQHEHCSTPNNEKSESGLFKSNGLCLKRKWWLDDKSRLKRTRLSDEAGSSLADGAWMNKRFSCSNISKNLKRMSVDEMMSSRGLKKIRHTEPETS